MLASITALGERSRGFSWRVTSGAFAVGATTAGALAGALAGAIGSFLPGGVWRDAVGLAVLVGALGVDASPLRRHLPSTRRQVNEDWLGRYRGWVYGVAFGAQLGVGVATIVTSAAIYAAAAGALLSGSALGGGAIGAALGLTRALSLLPAGRIRDGESLTAIHTTLGGLEGPATLLLVVAEIAAALIVLGVLA
jgi:hypothetical protein